MSRLLPALPMSQIIACDAPLLSPVDQQWDSVLSPALDNLHFNYSYYTTSTSPHHTDSPQSMLKVKPSLDSDPELLCLPTHKVFDLPEAHPLTPPTAEQRPSPPVSDALPSSAAKRSASPTPSVTKKRAIGDRINSKDFVPPDVSGLSKREARLVKNRAAAFLSRQRKREEFECMEVRVAELEQENARLLALTQSGNPASAVPPQVDNGLISEVEQLRAQLAAAEKRERELSAQLAIKAVPRDPPIKVEASEVSLPLSSAPRSTAPLKSGASLGLMVLLCALPTLLSMPMHSSVPTSFSIPTPLPASSASTFDYSSLLPHDYDWSRTTGSSLMDLDDDYPRFSPPSSIRKLEFADSAELGGLDISFDTTPANNGKIRVRIHPSSSPSSRATSPDSSSDTKSDVSSPSLDSMWSGSDYEPGFRSSFSSQSSSLSSLSSSSSDPFFGVGESSDFGMAFASNPSKMDSLDYGQSSDLAFGLGSEYNIPDSTGKTRRVRIALKSMPAAGGEGGEWEVQIC